MLLFKLGLSRWIWILSAISRLCGSVVSSTLKFWSWMIWPVSCWCLHILLLGGFLYALPVLGEYPSCSLPVLISAKIVAMNNQDEEPKTATVPKKILYSKFPFMSKTHNKKFQSSLRDIVGWYYPQIDLRLIFSNRHSIASMFPFKDSVPP